MNSSILDVHEFDADFERRLNENTSKLELERERQLRRRLVYFGGRTCRLLMNSLGRFCQVDLLGGNEGRQAAPSGCDGEARADLESKADARGARKWSSIRWSRLFQLLYAHCSIRSAINIYYQYVHDFDLVRYQRSLELSGGPRAADSGKQAEEAAKRLRASSWQPRESALVFNETLSELYRKRAEDSARTLRLIGAPYSGLTFGIEFFHVFILIMSFVLYLQTQFYFRTHHRFDFSLVRCFLDFPGELRACNALICKELNRFVESSRMFTRVALEQLQKQLAGFGESDWSSPPARDHNRYLFELQARERVPTSFAAPPSSAWHASERYELVHNLYQLLARDKLLDHFYTIKIIEQMALSGSLLPCNRSSEWIKTLSHWNSVLCIVFIVYCSLIQVVVLFTLPRMANITFNTQLMDLLAMFDSLILTMIVIVTSIFYGSLILTMSIDQVHLVRQLKWNVLRVIGVNTARQRDSAKLIERIRELAEPLNAPASQRMEASQVLRDQNEQRIGLIKHLSLRLETHNTQTDGELLHVLLEYKIFVAQLLPAKRSCGFVSLIAMTLMGLMPLIGCLHVPYIDFTIKFYVGMLSLLCAVVADVAILIPISYLHARSAELYKCLSSLLAHTVAMTSEQVGCEQAAAEADKEDDEHGSGLEFDLDQVRCVYNRHAVWLLRKELDQPDCLLDQFVTFVFGVRLNYSNLLKVHFWVGLLIKSIFSESASLTNQSEFLGGILMDPLALFEH